MRQLNTFLQLAKGWLIALGAIVKGYQISFRANGCNHELHVMFIMLAIYRWENMISNKKWRRRILKFCLLSAIFYT
jgi:hypothetical protein